MGGFGSGRWDRQVRKGTTDEFSKIDIRYLRKNELLPPGCRGTISWTRNGQPNGGVSFTVETDYLTLAYSFSQRAGSWSPVEQVIWFDRTRCNYGGERLWFLCPRCGRRVAILYGASELFLCRHCQNLSYASQNEDLVDRMARKFRNIRRRLGSPGNLTGTIILKPKHMHWKTFQQLKAEEDRANTAYAEALAKKVGLL